MYVYQLYILLVFEAGILILSKSMDRERKINSLCCSVSTLMHVCLGGREREKGSFYFTVLTIFRNLKRLPTHQRKKQSMKLCLLVSTVLDNVRPNLSLLFYNIHQCYNEFITFKDIESIKLCLIFSLYFNLMFKFELCAKKHTQ